MVREPDATIQSGGWTRSGMQIGQMQFNERIDGGEDDEHSSSGMVGGMGGGDVGRAKAGRLEDGWGDKARADAVQGEDKFGHCGGGGGGGE